MAIRREVIESFYSNVENSIKEAAKKSGSNCVIVGENWELPVSPKTKRKMSASGVIQALQRINQQRGSKLFGYSITKAGTRIYVKSTNSTKVEVPAREVVKTTFSFQTGKSEEAKKKILEMIQEAFMRGDLEIKIKVRGNTVVASYEEL